MRRIKKIFFQVLARVNKKVMPRYSRRDINQLSKVDKLLVAYRYYVTKNALEE